INDRVVAVVRVAILGLQRPVAAQHGFHADAENIATTVLREIQPFRITRTVKFEMLPSVAAEQIAERTRIQQVAGAHAYIEAIVVGKINIRAGNAQRWADVAKVAINEAADKE